MEFYRFYIFFNRLQDARKCGITCEKKTNIFKIINTKQFMFIRLFKQECYKAETRLLNLNWREIMERREQKISQKFAINLQPSWVKNLKNSVDSNGLLCKFCDLLATCQSCWQRIRTHCCSRQSNLTEESTSINGPKTIKQILTQLLTVLHQ